MIKLVRIGITGEYSACHCLATAGAEFHLQRIDDFDLYGILKVEKVSQLMRDALDAGATARVGGEFLHEAGPRFFPPAVLENVRPEMEIARSEIFGPVASLIRFGSEQEALSIANDTPYGLAAYFYARDVGRIWRVMEGLEYGIVGVNEGVISTEVAPFGGIKESGFGREGSRHGLNEYLERKYVLMGGLEHRLTG